MAGLTNGGVQEEESVLTKSPVVGAAAARAALSVLVASPALTVARVDFSRGAPRIDPPLDHDVVVIDGFWSDPWELRDKALSAPFRRQLSASGFAFYELRSSPSHTRRMAELVARACGEHLLCARAESRFVFETAADERETRKKVWIHYDRWQRVGVLYLVPNDQARGGTGFYRHRATGLSSVHQADALDIRSLVMADSTKDECWQSIGEVDMRFNRMVIFKPQIFHQALEYFGSSVEDGRLYCVVAFDIK